MQPQPQLAIDVSQRSPLLSTDAAGAILALSNDSMIARAESKYRWVWDVSLRGVTGKIRELRFLTAEIQEDKAGRHSLPSRGSTSSLELPEVLQLILGKDRPHFHPGEVELILRVTRPTRLALVKCQELAIQPGTTFYPRTSLENFLTRRLLNQSVPSDRSIPNN